MEYTWNLNQLFSCPYLLVSDVPLRNAFVWAEWNFFFAVMGYHNFPLVSDWEKSYGPHQLERPCFFYLWMKRRIGFFGGFYRYNKGEFVAV